MSEHTRQAVDNPVIALYTVRFVVTCLLVMYLSTIRRVCGHYRRKPVRGERA